jgi:glycosyltransferase involved in cell wall biosynthesis
MNFSLIIPCFNEGENLPGLIKKCSEFSDTSNIEIILVDNGSSDDTPEILAKNLPNYPHIKTIRVNKNQGYGHGIIAGLLASNGDIIGWTHADLQTDPADIVQGMKYFKSADSAVFVKGKRFGRSIADVFFTIGMSVFETILFRKSMWDINAQPTLFPKSFFESWEDPPLDFALDLYAYALASRKGMTMHRFPVRFGDRAYGVSHWNIDLKSKWKFIKRTITFSLKLKERL